MNKKWKSMAAVLLTAAGIMQAGCGTAGNGAKIAAQEEQVITDIEGHQIKVPAHIEKIAVVPLPWASVTMALDGGSERLAAIHPGAMSAYKGHFLEKLDAHFGKIDDKLINQDFSMNMEGMAQKGIQAAIIWNYQPKEREKLEKIGIAPVMIKNETIEDLQKSFLIVGELLGKKDRAEMINANYQKAYDMLKERSNSVAAAAKPVVVYLRNPKLALQGNDNFIREALDLAGAENPTGHQKSITMEEILRINPDIILLSNFDSFVPDDLYENRIAGQDWSNVKAVQNHRVYKVPMGIYRWDAPGVETPLMMEWLAAVMQPDIFHDVNVRRDTKQFLSDFMQYQASDADMAEIFADEANHQSLGQP